MDINLLGIFYCCRAVVPQRIIATGVSFGQPWFISDLVICSI